MISLLGFISFDVVYVAAVMNYAAQSEMNIKLIYAIASLIKQKHHKEIDDAIKVHVHCISFSTNRCIHSLILIYQLYIVKVLSVPLIIV